MTSCTSSSPPARRRIHFGNSVDIFTNGAQFYPGMRDAILAAESSIDMEAYIFQPGEVGDMLIDAMVDRARAGVEVRIVMDAIGSVGHGRPVRPPAARGRLHASTSTSRSAGIACIG